MPKRGRLLRMIDEGAIRARDDGVFIRHAEVLKDFANAGRGFGLVVEIVTGVDSFQRGIAAPIDDQCAGAFAHHDAA